MASLAFDSGKLLTLNAAGRVRALSPATGVQLWSAQLPQELTYVEPPTAVSGRLFVVGDGNQSTTFALNVATGRVLWTNTADPARGAVVGGGKVYLAGGLDRARALTRNGAALWDTIYCCLVPLTPVLHGNTLWVRDWADATYALSTSGGTVKFTLPFSAPPAVSGDRALLTTSDGVAAYSASTGRRLWLQPAVTGSAPPVISGNIAYVGTRTFKGTVYGLDLATGAVVWTGATGTPIELGEYNAVLRSSLAVGGGMLLVPSGGTLTAFRWSWNRAFVSGGPASLSENRMARDARACFPPLLGGPPQPVSPLHHPCEGRSRTPASSSPPGAILFEAEPAMLRQVGRPCGLGWPA